jgi:hypothetical protein
MFQHLRYFSLVCACLFVGVLGCGGSTQVPVSGKLVVNGKEFKPEAGTSVSVNFHAKVGSAFGIATFADSGEYTVSSNGKSGLPEGDYVVTVSVSKPSNPKDPYSLPTSLINTDYADKSLGKITLSVKANAPPGTYDIKVGR